MDKFKSSNELIKSSLKKADVSIIYPELRYEVNPLESRLLYIYWPYVSYKQLIDSIDIIAKYLNYKPHLLFILKYLQVKSLYKLLTQKLKELDQLTQKVDETLRKKE